MQPAIVFDRVWKKFRRGERHDSLRDLLPATARRLFRPRPASELEAEEFWALQDVSFEVRPGEALGIIGPNGAGKSTALKLLTRILKPTRGRCALRGRVGALIEISAGFHPDLTGRENLFLQGAIMGMKRAEIARKADEIIDFAGIEEFIDTPVKRYSSGMNARLGFAIAAHVDPDVLLIDEVLAVGDFSFQQKCYGKLDDFKRAGVAVVLVSHNMQAVAALCDRALLLRRGQPALHAGVADATAAYATAAMTAADPRVAVLTSDVSDAAGSLRRGEPLVPGSEVTLDVEIRTHQKFPRCCVGFELVRSDGQIMFHSGSMLNGVPPEDVPADSVLRARIQFSANVLRGTYVMNLSLLDDKRQWPAVVLHGLGSFVVHETSRIAGCAELAPAYDLSCRPAGDATGDALPRGSLSAVP